MCVCVCVCYLDSFREDEEGCEDEEESVDEAGQNLSSDITETQNTDTLRFCKDDKTRDCQTHRRLIERWTVCRCLNMNN